MGIEEEDFEEKSFIEIVEELRGNLPDIENPQYPEEWHVPEFSFEDLTEIPWDLFKDLREGWLEPFGQDSGFYYDDDGVEINLEPSDIAGIFGKQTVFEPCAWYQSPHLWGTQWGIYIEEKCVTRIAQLLPRMDPTVHARCRATHTYEPAILSTLGMLFLHELYHFSVDSCATHLGFVTKEPNLYPNYFHGFYVPNYLTPACLEEALATRYTYDRDGYLKMEKITLEVMFDAQPDGYRQYKTWVRPNVRFGERKMVRTVLNYGVPKAKLGRLPTGAWFETFQKYANQISYFRGYRIPIFLVPTHGSHLFRIRGARIK